MNLYVILVYIIIRNDNINAQLVAIHHSPYVLKLYNEIKNEEYPAESEQPHTRKLVCEEIFDNNSFRSTGWTLVDPLEIFMNRHRRYCHRAARKLYSLNDQNYMNPYILKTLRINSRQFNEHVFVCLVRATASLRHNFMSYYVSKEYDVGSAVGLPYKPGRFVFLRTPTAGIRTQLVLAEEGAHVHAYPDFNVELYYLEIRKYVKPEHNRNINPLCRVISDEESDPNNQYQRLCIAVIRSAPFTDTIMRPISEPQSCFSRKISFKTTAHDTPVAAEKTYYEQMSLCFSGPDQNRVYISRGYRSGELFVYKRDVTDGKIYLENLSVNVSIQDELSSLDFVEE